MKYMTVKIKAAIIKQNAEYSKEIKAFGVQEMIFGWFQSFYPSFLEQNDFSVTQFGTNLRVAQTQTILFLKSMSEKVGSTI